MSDKKPRKKLEKVKTYNTQGAMIYNHLPKASNTRGEQVNAALKSKKIGSKARSDAYRKLGLKQDHTTTGHKIGGEKAKGLKKVKASTTPKAKVLTTKVATKKVDSKRKSKLRAKGEKALSSGKTRKAQRIRKRYDKAK